MVAQLDNAYSFDAELVERALRFPAGTFVVLDDLALTVNGLGRKVVQTAVVDVGGRQVSVGYVDDDQTPYELVLDVDNPVALGTYTDLRARFKPLHDRLQDAFGGAGHFSVHDMVTAMVRAQETPSQSATDLVAWARRQVRRTAWVIKHRCEALTDAPVNWNQVGI